MRDFDLYLLLDWITVAQQKLYLENSKNYKENNDEKTFFKEVNNV